MFTEVFLNYNCMSLPHFCTQMKLLFRLNISFFSEDKRFYFQLYNVL